jgi:hypothetical protein
LIIIDEIGKMECFSELFRHLVEKVLDSDKVVLATIALKGGGFIETIKKRDDIQLIELVESRRETLVPEIDEIKDLMSKKKLKPRLFRLSRRRGPCFKLRMKVEVAEIRRRWIEQGGENREFEGRVR